VKDHDFVVVGGGTAGCVLAARLSQDPGVRVLLLEAGNSGPAGIIDAAASWPQLTGSDADWGGVTVPQALAGPVPYPRGKVLGGSGAINAMAHVRGHAGIYDAWEAAGAHGWGFAGLLPFFRRSEHADGDRDRTLRGLGGPVRVAPVPETHRHPVADAFAQALCQLGYPVTGDLSGRRQEGVAWPDLAINEGRRVSSASAYLRPARDRANLTVRTGCHVTRLTLRHGRCTGVSYLRDGRPETAHAAAEVIVCAGAVGTPQLLMLSGIGPAGHLRDLGIDVVADLPGTGSNLQDHPVAMCCYSCAVPLPPSAYNHGETYSALSSPLAGAWPDLHVFPILLPVAPPGLQAPAGGFALVASAVAPDSRGSVRLASASPLDAPLIDPGLLREPADLERLETGLAIIRQAAAGAAFARLGVTEAHPGPGIRGGDLRAWIRRTVSSYYHPAGTCRIGPGTDPGAVVDPELRVHGITGLRVADASVTPVIPNAHPNATVLAIAEHAASLIAGRRSPGRAPAPAAPRGH
jgi:choline dehydrogenase